MINRIGFVLLLMCSCSTTQEHFGTIPPAQNSNQYENIFQKGHWTTLPKNGELIIIGIANHQRNQEDEIQIAIDDAAHKLALFKGIKCKVSVVTTNGSGFWDYSMETDSVFDYDTEHEKYVQYLKFDVKHDILKIDGALLLRTRFITEIPLAIKYNFDMQDGIPKWIKNPPDMISGYIVGIGYSRPQSKFKDAVSKSYKSAIASIIGKLSTENESRIANLTDGTTTGIDIQTSEGALREFLSLATWIDPQTQAVWTLAIAKSAI